MKKKHEKQVHDLKKDIESLKRSDKCVKYLEENHAAFLFEDLENVQKQLDALKSEIDKLKGNIRNFELPICNYSAISSVKDLSLRVHWFIESYAQFLVKNCETKALEHRITNLRETFTRIQSKLQYSKESEMSSAKNHGTNLRFRIW